MGRVAKNAKAARVARNTIAATTRRVATRSQTNRQASVESEDEVDQLDDEEGTTAGAKSASSQGISSSLATAVEPDIRLHGTAHEWNQRDRYSPGSETESEEDTQATLPPPPTSSHAVSRMQKDIDEETRRILSVNIRRPEPDGTFYPRPAEAPLEHHLALAINKAMEPVAFSAKFRNARTAFDDVIRMSAGDWLQDGRKIDPRKIGNAERRRMEKLRKQREKTSLQRTKTDKARDRAARHLTNIGNASSGKRKPHLVKKMAERSQKDLKVLLAHNERVAAINSVPPLFTVWERPYKSICLASICIVNEEEKEIKANCKLAVMIRCTAGVRKAGGYTPVGRLHYHVKCLPYQQLLAAIDKSGETLFVTGNWSEAACIELNALYTKAAHFDTQNVTPPPQSNMSPTSLNLTIRQQRHLNKRNPARRRRWELESAKWKQEQKEAWQAQNSREVLALRDQLNGRDEKIAELRRTILKTAADKQVAVAEEKQKTAESEARNTKIEAAVWSRTRRRGAKKWMKRLNFSYTMDVRTAHRQFELQKLQIALIVSKAIAEDEIVCQKIFDTVQKQYPGNPDSVETFQQQLEQICYMDPDGQILEDFQHKIIGFLSIDPLATVMDDTSDNLEKEVADITAEQIQLFGAKA